MYSSKTASKAAAAKAASEAASQDSIPAEQGRHDPEQGGFDIVNRLVETKADEQEAAKQAAKAEEDNTRFIDQ